MLRNGTFEWLVWKPPESMDGGLEAGVAVQSREGISLVNASNLLQERLLCSLGHSSQSGTSLQGTSCPRWLGNAETFPDVGHEGGERGLPPCNNKGDHAMLLLSRPF